jgi:hypothetical protein
MPTLHFWQLPTTIEVEFVGIDRDNLTLLLCMRLLVDNAHPTFLLAYILVPMILEAFLANLNIADNAILIATTEFFKVDLQCILFIKDICDPDVPDDLGILIERRDIGGDFPLVLTFYVKAELLSDRNSDELDWIIFFCHKLGCKALIGDLDLNPYSWYLVNEDRSVLRIYVNAAKLDDDGQFAIDWILSKNL